ncbi:MAG TPA: hypothetical protein DEP84_28760, partial [Chloroflexi bacterium]|nr:hypothetical protein [Chloroflexota bacterium]
MSNAGSSATPIISLPKGGGALQGIGEKFAPDLHTGTGNFTVPIVLPPGRNGLQPMLNLVYSTGNGNGLFGLGWALSLPGVSRKTSKGVPRYDDAHDVFVLAGAEDLVRMTGTCPGRVRYMPRTEGSFSRIEHVCGPDDDYWQVQSRDGLTSFYGTPRPLAPPPGWRDPAIITKPAAERRAVFAWKLAQTRDPFGNQIQYQYGLRDVGQADGHTWDQPLLSLIRYAEHGDPADPEFLVWVRFEYEPRPNDPISDYRAGFEIRTTQRCKRILIETHADAARPVREYAFEYEPDPWNGVSLLKRVRLTGFDDGGQPVPELPALDLGYTAFEPQKRRFAPLTGSDLPAQALSSPDLALVDLFGQGLPDLLEMNGTVRYWRNRGNGRFDLPRPMRDAPAGLGLADPGVQLVDANGDGRSDLLVTRPGLAGYFPLQFGGLWDRKAFRRYQVAPSFSLQDPRVRLVDLDGDGVTDAIRSGTRLECFFNDPHTGWNGTHEVERKALADFPDIDFADPRVHWADMTGDGLQDLVLVYDGNIEYWPNLGRGAWGPRLHMRFSPHFPYGYDPTRILVGDVDGDGAADLVYVDDRRVLLWLNHSGNAWSEEPVTIEGTPPVTNIDAVRLADVLGRGVSGVLWSTNAPGSAHHTLWFLDLTGGRKPYLLDSIENHIGALTRIEYAPSTEFYVADERDPRSRWRTPLPFPVQVVKSVETIDRVSGGKLTTQYRYHHGYWDGAEREFRGFGMVEQLDTQTFADYSRPGLAGQRFAPVAERHFSPPTLTKTWFHQGAVGDETGEWAELDYSAEYWEEDAQLLGQAEGINAVLATFPQTPESRRARRDALRALRGTVLRTELYALDDSPSARRPYTVTEHAYGLCEVVLENGAARLRCGGPG